MDENLLARFREVIDDIVSATNNDGLVPSERGRIIADYFNAHDSLDNLAEVTAWWANVIEKPPRRWRLSRRTNLEGY